MKLKVGQWYKSEGEGVVHLLEKYDNGPKEIFVGRVYYKGCIGQGSWFEDGMNVVGENNILDLIPDPFEYVICRMQHIHRRLIDVCESSEKERDTLRNIQGRQRDDITSLSRAVFGSSSDQMTIIKAPKKKSWWKRW